MPPGQLLQGDTLLGNHFLVGRDHRLARRQRLSYPVAGGMQPPCQLHHDVRIGAEDLIEVFCPEDGRGDPGNPFTIDSAVEDAAQRHALWRVFTQNASHRSAHGAKTQNGDLQGDPASILVCLYNPIC